MWLSILFFRLSDERTARVNDHIWTSTPKRTIRYKSEVHYRWGLPKECRSWWLLAVTSLDAPETCAPKKRGKFVKPRLVASQRMASQPTPPNISPPEIRVSYMSPPEIRVSYMLPRPGGSSQSTKHRGWYGSYSIIPLPFQTCPERSSFFNKRMPWFTRIC